MYEANEQHELDSYIYLRLRYLLDIETELATT